MLKISDLSRNKELVSKLVLPKFIPIKIHEEYMYLKERYSLLKGNEFGKQIEKLVYSILLRKNESQSIYKNLTNIIGDDITIEKQITHCNILGYVDISTERTLVDIKSYITAADTKFNKAQILMYNIFNNVYYDKICLYNPLIGVLWIAKCDVDTHIISNFNIISKYLNLQIVKNFLPSSHSITEIPIFRGVFSNNHRFMDLQITTKDHDIYENSDDFELNTTLILPEESLKETMYKGGFIVYSTQANFENKNFISNYAYPHINTLCNGELILTKVWEYNFVTDSNLLNTDNDDGFLSGYAYIPLTDYQVKSILMTVCIGHHLYGLGMEEDEYNDTLASFSQNDILERIAFQSYVKSTPNL